MPADLHLRVANDFSYHPPSTPDVARKHEDIRTMLMTVALRLVDITPPGREQSLMLTALEEACFWANASVARNQAQEGILRPQ